MISILGLVLVSTCVLSSPLPTHYDYYNSNPYLEKDIQYDYPLYEPAIARKPINHGFYYSPQQIHPEPHRTPEIPQAHPYLQFAQQRPYHQFSQQYQGRPMTVINPGHSANLVNQIHPGGNRIQEVQQQNQDPYSSDVGTILSQFVNGFREQVQQQGIYGRPQTQGTYSTIQFRPNPNGDHGIKDITAIIYNSETGAVQEIPALVYSSNAGVISTQLGPGTQLVSSFPQKSGQSPEGSEFADSPISLADSGPCQNKGPDNIQNPARENTESAEDFIAAENVSPEPTPGIGDSTPDYNNMKPANTVSQAEIDKKYPVTILIPDSTASSSSDNSNSNRNINVDSDSPVQVTDNSEFVSETSTVVPSEVVSSSSSSVSVGDNVSSSITSTTAGPPPEWDVLTENLNKAIEGETTVSDIESPTPK